MRLLPREEKFFALFNRQAELISEAARLMNEGAHSGNAQLAGVAKQIMDLEHKGDEVIHEIFTRLNQTFITPLDPEDIHSLSSSLDDVLDGIEESIHRIVAFRITQLPPAALQLCEIVYTCCQALQRAFLAMEKNAPMMEHCIEVNRLENEADRIGRKAVQELFDTQKDPILLIKLKEVYEFLEATTDRCEDVADVLQNVVVKNS